MKSNNSLQKFLENIIHDNPTIADSQTKTYFLKRVREGKPTRDENPVSHFGSYAIAYDKNTREVFLGLHKKSGLWLFSGGHLDRGEMPFETLKREIDEEWGIPIDLSQSNTPLLLSITKIVHNPQGRPCREHFDISYFIPVDKNTFNPRYENITQEFIETKWLTISEANKITTDPTTLKVVTLLENNLF